MIDPEEREFAIAVGILDDCRRYVAARKIQRWDVVKWGVSVNLTLAVAAAAPALADFRPYLLLLSAGVAAASWGLVLQYKRRMTRIRDQAVTVVNWLRLEGVDNDAITGQSTQDDDLVGETYDLQEFYMFLAILVASSLQRRTGTAPCRNRTWPALRRRRLFWAWYFSLSLI